MLLSILWVCQLYFARTRNAILPSLSGLGMNIDKNIKIGVRNIYYAEIIHCDIKMEIIIIKYY